MFGKLGDDDHDARARLSASPAVVARANADGTVTVIYALDTIAPGTVLRPTAGPGWSGPGPAEVLAGTAKDRQGKPVPRTGAGDLVVFTAGHAAGGNLVVAGFAGRVHDGVAGKAQGVFCLAAPSKISSSKRGLTQFVTILDPSATVNVATPEALGALALDVFAREWPGGTPGLVLRNAKGDTQDAMADGPVRGDPAAAAAGFAARLLRSGALNEGPVEMIPAWSLHVGRDQAMRERVDPRSETACPVTGAFGSLYADPRGRPQLAPSVVLVADEEEWAFGGKTGKVHRVALAVQPLGQRERHQKSNVPTAYRKPRNAVPWFVREVERDPLAVVRAADARAARAPKPPAAATAPSRAAPERQDVAAFPNFRKSPAVGQAAPARAAAPTAATASSTGGTPGRMGRMGRPGIAPSATSPTAPAAREPAPAGSAGNAPRRPARMGLAPAAPATRPTETARAPAAATPAARPAGRPAARGISALMAMDDEGAPAFGPR